MYIMPYPIWGFKCFDWLGLRSWQLLFPSFSNLNWYWYWRFAVYLKYDKYYLILVSVLVAIQSLLFVGIDIVGDSELDMLYVWYSLLDRFSWFRFLNRAKAGNYMYLYISMISSTQQLPVSEISFSINIRVGSWIKSPHLKSSAMSTVTIPNFSYLSRAYHCSVRPCNGISYLRASDHSLVRWRLRPYKSG